MAPLIFCRLLCLRHRKRARGSSCKNQRLSSNSVCDLVANRSYFGLGFEWQEHLLSGKNGSSDEIEIVTNILLNFWYYIIFLELVRIRQRRIIYHGNDRWWLVYRKSANFGYRLSLRRYQMHLQRGSWVELWGGRKGFSKLRLSFCYKLPTVRVKV